MVETCVGPSELHLKKELTALQKARFLRDPETCSSWRSPLRSNSDYVSSDFKCLDGIRGNSTDVNVNGSGGLPEIPPRSGNRRKAYLYNWRLNSTKSSDTPEDGLDNHHKTDPNSDTNIEIPVKVRTSFAPARRTSRKLKRSSISKQRLVKNSDSSKLLDLPANSFGGLNSVEHSDDTEECYSEDIGRQLKHVAAQKNGYGSHVPSPLFSGSGRGNRSYCSKILSTRREDSSHSYTPASTSSYYKYGGRNPSTVGSWDETTGSLDVDDLDQLDLQGRQGCGLPCYGSRRTKGRGCGGFYSPSLSDILRRKRSNNKRSSSSYIKNRTSQDLPLLTNSADGGDSSVGPASDDLSTNIGELELEALSRLDGRRWPSCKSQEGFESARHIGSDLEMANPRSLSQKYRLTSFDDIIGQNIVVHSLSNATTRGRIAPAYLFHGPRGTGKTSTARIFTAALNCLSTEGKKPCGVCRECTHSLNGDSSHFREVDATDKKGIDRVRYLLKNISVATKFSKYNVFVIDQCHMLSTKMWSAFMKFLEEPPPRVVFVFITIDLDNLSRAIVSRCQKYLFTKVKDSDIMNRLRKISAEENLDVESDALALISMNSDGSLRDAETMLDQLSLLGKRITTSLVNDLVGVVSDEKLLDLLEIAMSSDTSETVKRSRELMDSGVDPMALMSQLAGLIMDIIAGTYRLASSQHSSIALGGRSLNEAEIERLQAALKILSDAEKQLRLSSERSTWFTAALLQLGSCHNVQHTRSSSSGKQSTKKMNDGAFDTTEETTFREDKRHPLLVFRQQNLDLTPRATSHRPTEGTLTSDTLPANSHSVIGSLMDSTRPDATGKRVSGCVNPDKLAEIWKRCIGKCHSETLRQLLFAHGKLSSIIGTEGALIVFIDFEDSNVKTRAERYLSSITNSIELALNHNVEVRIGLASGNSTNELKSMPHSAGCNHTEKVGVSKNRKFESQSVEEHENSLVRGKGFEVANFPVNSMKRNNGAQGTAEKRQEILALRAHSMAIDEQRLESAWLQVAERNASGSASHSRSEKSQVLSQNGSSCGNHIGLSTAKQWENELNYQFKTIKDSDAQGHPLNRTGGKLDHYDISPSVLHSSSFTANFDSDNRGYESGPGCNGLFCWNTRKTHEGKVKQRTHVKSQKPARISLFGYCGKPKAPESRLRR